MGMVVEIKPRIDQLVAVYGGFARGVALGQDPPVFPQDVVDVPHQVVGVAVPFIMVSIPAIIGTEFFVHPPGYGFPAFQASSFFGFLWS